MVTIDPEAVDPDDVEMLQDLVLAVLHDAVAQVNAYAAEANPLAGMAQMAGGLDLGGLDLGGLLGIGGDAAIVEVGEASAADRPFGFHGGEAADGEDEYDADGGAGPGGELIGDGGVRGAGPGPDRRARAAARRRAQNRPSASRSTC